jgi:hypothetical protein
MTEDQEERFVVSFEKIAKALEGIHEEAKRAGSKYWPHPREQRQSVLTRVGEDKERELRLQGARRRTIEEVIDPNIEEVPDEEIGERTRQWLRDHPQERKEAKKSDASPKTPIAGEAGGTGIEEAEGKS